MDLRLKISLRLGQSCSMWKSLIASLASLAALARSLRSPPGKTRATQTKTAQTSPGQSPKSTPETLWPSVAPCGPVYRSCSFWLPKSTLKASKILPKTLPNTPPKHSKIEVQRGLRFGSPLRPLFFLRRGLSWGVLVTSWGRLGASWGRRGASWGLSWRVFCLLGAPWRVLEASWVVFEQSWRRLGSDPEKN